MTTCVFLFRFRISLSRAWTADIGCETCVLPAAMRTDLLLLTLLLPSCRSRLLATSPLPVWSCTEEQGAEIKPVIIDGSRQRAGIIQTPNFPDQFKLPIECVWMIDLSGMPRQYVAHIYFTQVNNFVRFLKHSDGPGYISAHV